MTRANKALVIVVVSALGLWGCAQGPSGNASSGDSKQLKELQSQVSKLENDYRGMAAARDKANKELSAARAESQNLKTELEHQQVAMKEREQLLKERDELRMQLQARTAERDNVQAQFEEFRKGIRSLLGQADASISPVTEPAISVLDTTGPGKS